jgi:hypothetical protein
MVSSKEFYILDNCSCRATIKYNQSKSLSSYQQEHRMIIKILSGTYSYFNSKKNDIYFQNFMLINFTISCKDDPL